MNNGDPNEFILKGGRFSFLKVRKAVALKGGKPRFTTNYLLDPKDPEGKKQIKAVKDRIDEIAMETFGKKLPRERTCLRKDDEPQWDGYEDKWYISCARPEDQGPPAIVNKNLQPIPEGSAHPVSGDYGDLKIRLYPQEEYKNINASLEVVQYVKEGEPFGGGGAASVEGMTAYNSSDDEDGLDDDDDLEGDDLEDEDDDLG